MWGVTKEGNLCRKLTKNVIMKIDNKGGTQRLASIDEFYHPIALEGFLDRIIDGSKCLRYKDTVYRFTAVDELFEAYGSEVLVGMFEAGDIVVNEADYDFYYVWNGEMFVTFHQTGTLESSSTMPYSGRLIEKGFRDKYFSYFKEELSILDFKTITKDDNGEITIS